MRHELRNRILGGFPQKAPLEVKTRRSRAEEDPTFLITTERGMVSQGLFHGGSQKGTLFLLADGREWDGMRQQWREIGFQAVELGYRHSINPDPVAGVADHDDAEWGLWVSRPLLGQWVWDILRWLDAADELKWKRPYVLVGLRAMSLPAILAAALDPRVAGVACSGCLVSLVGQKAKPWSGVPMGLIAPNILDVGDVGHLAALVAPRPLVVSGGVEPEGGPATAERLSEAFAFTHAVYRLLGAWEGLTVERSADLRRAVPRS
jgi:hypothetical protein